MYIVYSICLKTHGLGYIVETVHFRCTRNFCNRPFLFGFRMCTQVLEKIKI